MICSVCDTPLPDGSRNCAVCGADLAEPGDSDRRRAALNDLLESLRVAAAERYRISGLLGRGGMGAVFLAEDLRLERPVAIKVLRPDLAEDSAFVGRFQREARMSARLDHPNIIPIYEVERLGDFHYFVMKYVAGRSLEQLLTGELPIEDTVSILWQAACGLGHAHQRGVIHRDVKPSNIMLDENGRVVITDFGISKALGAVTQYTTAGQIVGSPRYMSPEQASGVALDGRADQYSLAVVGYHMLTGRLPLIGESVHALIYMHMFEVPAPARSLRPEIPAHVSDALQRALAKAPADRYPTMEEFATALWPERPVGAGTPTAPPRITLPRVEPVVTEPVAARGTGSTARRRTLTILAALLFAGIAITLLVVSRVRPTASAARGAAPVAVPQPSESGARQPDTSAGSALPITDTTVPPAVPVPPARAKPEGSRSAQSVVKRHHPAREPPRPRAPVTVPPPAPSETTAVGFLTINAQPYGTVMVDGVEIGDTPLVRYKLAPGQHRFTITREGYHTDSATFIVSTGNEVRVSRTLTKAGE